MKVLAFAVYDRAAQGFSMPFFQPTRGLAERVFAETCTDQSTLMAKHPSDFELFEIGVFDSVTGGLEALPSPVCLTTAVQTLSLRAVADG